MATPSPCIVVSAGAAARGTGDAGRRGRCPPPAPRNTVICEGTRGVAWRAVAWRIVCCVMSCRVPRRREPPPRGVTLRAAPASRRRARVSVPALCASAGRVPSPSGRGCLGVGSGGIPSPRAAGRAGVGASGAKVEELPPAQHNFLFLLLFAACGRLRSGEPHVCERGLVLQEQHPWYFCVIAASAEALNAHFYLSF